MAKIDFKRLVKNAAKIAVPVIAIALTRKLTTGKLDLKATALDAGRLVLTDRAGA